MDLESDLDSGLEIVLQDSLSIFFSGPATCRWPHTPVVPSLWSKNYMQLSLRQFQLPITIDFQFNGFPINEVERDSTKSCN